MEQIFHSTKPLVKHCARFDRSAHHGPIEKRRHLRNDVLAQFERLRLVRKLFTGFEKNHVGLWPQIAWEVSGRAWRYLRGLRFARTESGRCERSAHWADRCREAITL